MRETIAAVRSIGSDTKGVALLTLDYSNAGEVWVAECLELGTVTEDSTLEDVRRRIIGTVTLQLNQMEELGGIDAFLEDHGVRVMPIVLGRHGIGGSTWSVAESAAAA